MPECPEIINALNPAENIFSLGFNEVNVTN